MPNRKKNNPTKPNHLKDLTLLFAVPIGIAVFAAVVIYTPRLFANPKYDFIYSVCNSYSCGEKYTVGADGRLVGQSTGRSISVSSDPETIRYYNADSDSTRSLSLAEAKQYRLDTSSKSPDGYSLVREESSGGFMFWGEYNSGWYLKKGAAKKQVELTNNSSYYSEDIKFKGWVEE